MTEYCLSCGSPVKQCTNNNGEIYAVCIYCGATYHSATLQNQNSCEKNKLHTKKSPKNKLVVPIIILSFVLACLCIVYALICAGVFEEKSNLQTTKHTNTYESEKEPLNNVKPQINTNAVADVDKKIEYIKSLYYKTQEDLGGYTSQVTDGYTVYYDSYGNIKKVDYKLPYNNYTANYYYENNELYFSFIFDGTKENRFYIYNNTVFRWIDELGNIIDNDFENETYMNWYELILSENEKIKNSLMN